MFFISAAAVRIPRNMEKRIYGGHDCTAMEREYHVDVGQHGARYGCGGSLLNPHWVLTAGQGHVLRRG